MTGFGRGRAMRAGQELTVEIRSVNHRFLEVRVTLPPELGRFHGDVERVLRERFARGRLDVYVTLGRAAASRLAPRVDGVLAARYLDAYKALAGQLGLHDAVDLRLLLEAPGVVSPPEADLEMSHTGDALQSALGEAAEELESMRRTEGVQLARALGHHVDNVASLVARVADRAPVAIEQRKRRLDARVADLLGGASLEPVRLAQELALLVDRHDISEELERLGVHVGHVVQLLRSAEPVGRKLDFLLQEMNRETNTIGAKASDALIAQAVVDIKAELERLREQVQNLE